MNVRITGCFASLVAMLLLLNPEKSFALADANFEAIHFSGSGQCVECHDGLSTADGKDISIVENWSSSMMANAARDPYWLAKVASEVHRNPDLSNELNDTCSRCHAPMANESARKAGDPVLLLDGAAQGDGFLDENNAYHDQAMDGVSCTACHQIRDDSSLGTLDGFSGNFKIDTYGAAVDRPAYGSYANPVSNPMRNRVKFTPKQGEHTQESSLCASCHNLKTPFVDADGDIVSTTPESQFPEQMVYTEWNNSDFQTGGENQRSCQSCHMPQLDEPVAISTQPPGLAARQGFSEHSFVGANTTMMDILNQNAVELGVTASGFEQSIAETRAFLQTSARLEVRSSSIVDGVLNIELKISNLSGHKLPSSYPSRRVYIHFKATDERGNILFESGKTNADGSILGVASDTDSATFEPHYQLISDQNQVQVYEPIMQNSDGDITHTLLRAATYKKDNRLTPAGFDKTIVPEDVAVKGAAVNDEDFNLGSDLIVYQFNVGTQTNVRIDASLQYQALSYGHLQDLFKESQSLPEVAAFQGYFDAASIRSETLASVSVSIGESKSSFYVIPSANGKTIVFDL